MPAIDIQLYAGDSAKAGITRAQNNETLSCSSPAFDQYACMTYADLKKVYGTLLQCKDWGPVSLESQSKAYKRNPQVIDHINQKH